MIEAIALLGKYETDKKDLERIDPFIEETKLKNIMKVICIVFKKNGENIVYDHTHSEEYDSQNPRKYLYRSHQSRRFDVTPTTKISYDSKNKKPKINEAFNRIQYWFEKFIPILNNEKYSKQQIEFLEQIRNEILKNREKIFEDVSKRCEELKDDEKRNSVLTIKIKEDGNEKYIGSFDIFKKILMEEGLKFVYSRHGVEIKGKGICSICGKEGEVSDYTLLKIYSVDKRGFAPEFAQKNAWKRLPICPSCLPYLITGENFLNKYLKKRFYQDYQFYVIPKFILGDVDENLIEEIKRQEKREEYKGLLIEDDYFLDPIKDRGDILNLVFMFCEFGQSVKVVKYVEDVSPSWIKKLDITLNKEITNLSIFKEETLKKIGIVGKKKSGDLKDIDRAGTRIGGLVEAFFPKSKETGVYSKYFIDVIGDILNQKPINKDLLMIAFMRELRNKHLNEDVWNEKILALKSLMLFLFLKKLNLIKEGE
ncbi:MAG: hypothetical protein H5T44_03880 [Thermoplasmatales archaeon]|nr:hypothetical protein [Thermoplasmatales archaeon]